MVTDGATDNRVTVLRGKDLIRVTTAILPKPAVGEACGSQILPHDG